MPLRYLAHHAFHTVAAVFTVGKVAGALNESRHLGIVEQAVAVLTAHLRANDLQDRRRKAEAGAKPWTAADEMAARSAGSRNTASVITAWPARATTVAVSIIAAYTLADASRL